MNQSSPSNKTIAFPSSSSEEMTKETPNIKSRKPVKKDEQLKQSGISIRRQLLLAVLPAMLIPLIVASVIVSRVSKQNSEAQITLQLEERALLAGEVARGLLEEEFKVPAIVANNPLVINAARTASQRAAEVNLPQIPINELEKSFSASKLLQPNQDLNDYLRRTAKIAEIAQLYVTEKHGFNIGYNVPPYDFVQRDEQWWQKGKSKQRWVSSPDFNSAVRLFSIELVQAIVDPKSGKFLGIVKSVVPASRFDRVTRYLEPQKITGSQRVQLLTSSTGRVIATTTAEGASSTRRVNGGEAVVKVSESLVKIRQNPKLDLEKRMSDIQKQYSLQNLTFNRFDPDTEENAPSASFLYQDRYYTIYTIPRLDWVAVASMDSSEIISADNELILVFALTALVLLVTVVVMLLLLARQLSSPLVNLANLFEQVKSGDLDVVAQPVGNRESQALAGSLNNLVITIKSLLQQQKKQDVLQQELLQLQSDIEGLASGDLTVTANVKTASVANVADFVNTVIGSLRDILTQVKQAAVQVNSSIAENEGETRQLADRVFKQSAQISKILNSIEEMNLSLQETAEKAKVAAQIAHITSAAAETGGKGIEQTVTNISQLHSTLTAAAQKVKQLERFSQAITQAMAPINHIAMQTKVLAINANIEATKVEAKNPGLATVAEEVSALAKNLADVKQEIQQITEHLHRETSEVVEVLELELSQIEVGTSLGEKAKQDVEQILSVSQHLEELAQSIAQTTITQAQRTQSVTQSKKEMILASEETANSSLALSSSWQKTFGFARQLQISVETLKVGDET